MDTVLVFRNTKLDCWRLKLAGITHFAQTQDWRLQVIDGSGTAETVRELIAFWHPVGCIVEGGGGSSRLYPAHFGCTPVVFLDQDPARIQGKAPLVLHDSTTIGRVAARELLQLDLSAYAIVTWAGDTYWASEKRDAFLAVMQLHGKACKLFAVRDNNRHVGSIVSQRQLRKWLRGQPLPCGIFCISDIMAEQVMSAAAALNIRIPDDLVVLGADDDEQICEATSPTLTSIRPDIMGTGFEVARLLKERLDHPHRKATTVLVPPLSITRRQSTRRLRKNDSQVQAALELIRHGICDGIRAKDVLSAFACSRRQAEIRFRNLVGHSILDEIREIRFQKALEYLHRHDIALNAIADLSGWSSELMLRRYVKQKTGKTLLELRQAHLALPVQSVRTAS